MSNCTKPQREKQRPTAVTSNLATQCTMPHMSIFNFPTVGRERELLTRMHSVAVNTRPSAAFFEPQI